MVERINNFPSQQTDYLNGDDSVNYSIFNILNAGLSNEMFIPQSAYNTAENSDNIFLSTSFDIIRQQGRIRVVENEYPYQLSDKEDYIKWQRELEQARRDKSKKLKILPEAPSSINRLHAKLYKEINSGSLALNDRVLLQCRFAKSLGTDDALYIHEYDGEIGKGIAKDFYLNSLPEVAKKMGFRFIVGDQNNKNIDFFIDVIGRYQIFDLKSEYRNTLFGAVYPEELFTFQFLYPEDIEKYILPNRIKT